MYRDEVDIVAFNTMLHQVGPCKRGGEMPAPSNGVERTLVAGTALAQRRRPAYSSLPCTGVGPRMHCTLTQRDASMIHRVAVSCLALGCLASSPAVTAATGEQVRLPSLSGYIQAHHHASGPGNTLTEFVPQGQTVENWTDMVTVTRAAHMDTFSPRQFLGGIEEGWRAACPGADSHWGPSGEEQGRPFAILLLTCPINPTSGKPESTWFKGIQGLQAFHTVQKAFRTDVSPDDVRTWMAWLREVTLCGNRETPTCPPAEQPRAEVRGDANAAR